mmetsp:Transcript_7206/g.14196  ORF Transcript_7206/g.14196 Transcript_7206/m.14196 type:complete len:365 (-) Transcript_7206:2088-3182(-)|eukprot:CAMPEP_0182460538 /NCGR_PEP_ID=MMETSP1319-20130603/5385_1 /TAXON_ID=172717 /ORGANISM="Bolidomonas pacifica, Strain RCC208" /LENGTH=364 /DNA_ID=CAMNT_0024659657 /DNA_START=157 /DNA_END=1251 /DNA_ORIENTATION=+
MATSDSATPPRAMPFVLPSTHFPNTKQGSFEFVTPLPPPRLPSIFRKNPALLSEYLFFAVLLGISLLCLFYLNTDATTLSWPWLGDVFFATGLIPALSSLSDLVRSLTLRLPASSLPSLAFCLCGAALSPPGLTVVGEVCLEASLIYWILRSFMFVEHPDDEVRALRAEVASLKQSTALGLADGYYLNFLSWAARDLSKTNLLTSSGSTFPPPRPFILVLLPLTVDWSDPKPLLSLMSGYKKRGQYADCHFGKPSSNPRFRPQILSLHAEGKYVFDVPTTLQVVISNVRGQDDRDSAYKSEVSRFAARLAWRIETDRLEGVVKVVVCGGSDVLEVGEEAAAGAEADIRRRNEERDILNDLQARI